jgi:predicted O-methyltransferase YrrM
MRPQVVLETGVAFGVTSAFILAALRQNGQGMLHSIDLPPLARDADRFVGAAIPETLKPRWHLHRGSTRRLLPRTLHAVQAVDIFVHDSLHTYRNMSWEFDQVWPRLGPGGMIIADDIQGNSAFEELLSRDIEVHAVIRERAKGSLFGVARRRGSS